MPGSRSRRDVLTGEIFRRIANPGDVQSMPLVVNLATNGVACALMTPQALPIKDGLVEVPVKVPPEIYPGTYYMTVKACGLSETTMIVRSEH